MNFREIINAWIISFNPTEKQKELAEIRGKICDECPSKIVVTFAVCTECGCPVGKKIFTDTYNPCPLLKWKETDLPYFGERKNTKTLM